MRGWIRICSVLTALWVVGACGMLVIEYYRLDAQRELPYTAPPLPTGFVPYLQTDSKWFRWQLRSESGANYQLRLLPRSGRVAALLAFPVSLVWIAGLGCGWTRGGFSVSKRA